MLSLMIMTGQFDPLVFDLTREKMKLSPEATIVFARGQHFWPVEWACRSISSICLHRLISDKRIGQKEALTSGFQLWKLTTNPSNLPKGSTQGSSTVDVIYTVFFLFLFFLKRVANIVFLELDLVSNERFGNSTYYRGIHKSPIEKITFFILHMLWLIFQRKFCEMATAA